MKSARYAIPLIVVAQFACTSLWFAGNAVVRDIRMAYDLPENITGHMTAAVQFGFITGTLLFAIFTLTDRFSPSKIFLSCALAGAAVNLGVLADGGTTGLLISRYLTGFFLAGIYPVGMKIASDYSEKGLHTALGWLVGALVLGTAFPHLLKFLSADVPWKYVVIGTSLLAILGGTLIILAGDGPYRKKSAAPDFKKFVKLFRIPEVRRPALGYFGHMWELYTFWAFIPLAIRYYSETHAIDTTSASLWAFIIIGAGAPGCISSGYLAQRIGSHKTASAALLLSGLCCLTAPFFFLLTPPLFFIFLILWGTAVVADSPQFSTLVAQGAPKESVGTALTITNSVGFAITIISIQLINLISAEMDIRYLFLLLAPGPILGISAMHSK